MKILSSYSGDEPFAIFLKLYFSQNKKYGSRDRKQIAHLCYCYFRTAPHYQEESVLSCSGIEEEILRGLFLCSAERNEILQMLKPEWNEKVNFSVEEKLKLLSGENSFNGIFPWKNELSNGMDHEKFCRSFLVQPDLFLRLRPGKKEIVCRKLDAAGISYRTITDTCLALNNSEKIDAVVELDREAVIQDYNSQQTGDYFQLVRNPGTTPLEAWDCCAGSGGKSIMLSDLIPGVHLAVSDKRENILFNLRKRFERAGIKKYKSFVADLIKNGNFRKGNFDLILADVPCTGSGAWSRTPEQLHFFDEKKIDEYASLQKKIVSNVIPHLKHESFFIYITCSVFRKENEEAAEFIKEHFNLKLIKMELLNGYEMKADSMFIAVFRKSLEVE